MTKLVYYGKWFRAFCKSFYKYWEARVPKAGTIEAWTRGCSCPMTKNYFGHNQDLTFNSKCKLHKRD